MPNLSSFIALFLYYMDSHSFGGFNTSGSSFLQELTVEDPTKDVYTGNQVPQQRPYQPYQDPSSGHYASPSDIPSNSYYNGQYSMDPYCFNHPTYPPRSKYPEGPYATIPSSQTSPHPQVTPRPISGQSSLNLDWSDSQQYQSGPYTPHSTFQVSGGSGRLPPTNYPSGHISQVMSTPSPQHSYQGSSGNPYSVPPEPYCHNDMPPGAFGALSQQSQPQMHSLPLNGEPMNPYVQQSRIPSNIRQQLPKSTTKRSSKSRGSGSTAKSSYPSHEPTAQERFAVPQCSPNVISIAPTGELPSHPQNPPPPPHYRSSFEQQPPQIPPPIGGRCFHVDTKPNSVSLSGTEKEEDTRVCPPYNVDTSGAQGFSPLHVVSPDVATQPPQSSCTTSTMPNTAQISPSNLASSKSASGVSLGSLQNTAFSPNSEQVSNFITKQYDYVVVI